MEDRRFLQPLVLFLRTHLCGLGELGECERQTDLLNATLVRPPMQHQQGALLSPRQGIPLPSLSLLLNVNWGDGLMVSAHSLK